MKKIVSFLIIILIFISCLFIKTNTKAIASYCYNDSVMKQLQKTAIILNDDGSEALDAINCFISASEPTDLFFTLDSYLEAKELSMVSGNPIDFSQDPFYDNYEGMVADSKITFYILSISYYCLLNYGFEANNSIDLFRDILDHVISYKDSISELQDNCFYYRLFGEDEYAINIIDIVSDCYNNLLKGFYLEDYFDKTYNLSLFLKDVQEFLLNKSDNIESNGDELLYPNNKISKMIEKIIDIADNDVYNQEYFDNCLVSYVSDSNKHKLFNDSLISIKYDDLQDYYELDVTERNNLREIYLNEIGESIINILISVESFSYYLSNNNDSNFVFMNNCGPAMYLVLDTLEALKNDDPLYSDEYGSNSDEFPNLVNNITSLLESFNSIKELLNDCNIETETNFELYNELVIYKVKNDYIKSLLLNINSLNQTINLKISEIDQLSEEVESLDETITTLNSTISNLNQSIISKDTTIANNLTQISALNEEINSLENNITTLENSLSLKSAEISEYEELIQGLNATINSNNLIIENKQEEIDELNEIVTQLNNRITVINNELDDKKDSITLLESQMQELDETIIESNDYISSQDSKIKANKIIIIIIIILLVLFVIYFVTTIIYYFKKLRKNE